MVVLDTNHLRELAMGSVLGLRLAKRIEDSEAEVVTTIVSAEEVLRGRLAKLSSAKKVEDQVLASERLGASIQFLAGFALLPWDFEAADRFAAFQDEGVRTSTLDLKIACIVIEHDSTLLTRDKGDFAKIPGLKFENWLD